MLTIDGSAGENGGQILRPSLALSLLTASSRSTLTLEGGTHNPMAPPFDFLERSFLPLVPRIKMDAAMELEKEAPGNVVAHSRANRSWFGRCAPLVLGLWVLSAPSARSQGLLLSDNFNSPSTSAAGFNTTLAADQQGLVAPIAYTITTAGQDWQAQHGNGSMMLLAGDAGYGATAGLNFNFATLANLANSPLQINFSGYVDSTTTPGCWFSLAIGSAPNLYGFSSAARFGILPTWDGALQTWAGGSQLQATTHSGNAYTIVLANTAGTGSAFNGTGSVARLYNGSTLVNTYSLSQLGAGDGYVSYGADLYNGSWNLAHIDNLSISNLTGTISDLFLTWSGLVSHNWNTTQSNWTGAATFWNNTVGNAVFGAAAPGAITLTEPISARTITFTAAGYTLTGGSLALIGAQTITNNADATIASPILSGALNKYGSGRLTLSATNSYAGGTTVNAGTLQLTANGGNCPIVGTLTVNAGATVATTGDGTGLGFNPGQQVTTLNLNGGTVTSAGMIRLWNCSGGVNLTGGTLQSNGGSNSPSGAPLDWGDTVVNSYASGTTSVIAGRVNLRADDNSANASLWQLNVARGAGATDLLVSAAITESGLPVNSTTGGHCGITKAGAGTVRITGAVLVSGIISVEAGTLDFAPSSLNASARVSLASGARLLLSAAGTNTVNDLYLDGVKLAAGRWGAPGSVAAGRADFETPAIGGAGVILVTDSGLARRDRWKRMKYGQFTHYVWDGAGSVTRLPDGSLAPSIDYLASNFNAAQYANDLQSMGVEYVIFTAWHANFFPMFNSAAVSRALGFVRNSQRDLLGDMLTAVRAKGIRVLFYTHPNQPVIQTYTGHNNMINDVYGEVVDRYGDQIDGLYLDENDPSGNQDSAVDFPRLERTIHRRNPDLILIQNFYGNLYACDVPMGESGPQTANYSRDVGWPSVSAYAQVMSATWSAQVPTNTYAATRSAPGIFRAAVLAAGSGTEGGGWAWAAGPFPGGIWEQGVLATMQGAAQLMAPVARAVTNTYPSTSWPSYGTGYSWGAATRSADDTQEYVHVLWPPGGSTLALPPTADGKRFSNARLLASGNAVTLSQSARAVQLTLTGTNTWDGNDTVIALDVVAKGDQGIYNNTSPAITFAGSSWTYQGNRNLGEYGNDVQAATANGDSFAFPFSGTDVAFISSRGPGRGAVGLSLDGVWQTNLDLSVGTTNRDTVFSLSGLADGPHTLSGVKMSGAYLYVDAFKVSELLNDNHASLVYGNLTRFNNTDSASNSVGYITYTGTWSWQQRYGGEYDGDITWSQNLGDYFTIYFNGTGVRMIGDGLGTFSFYLDGAFSQTVNMNAGGNKVGVVGFDTNGLAPGSHQLQGVFAAYSPNSSAPYAQVDEFDVYTVVNGGWAYLGNRNLGDYQNDIHTTANTYDFVNLNFNGTGLDIVAPSSSAGGTVQVAVDGSVVEHVNEYAGALHPQATTFSSSHAIHLAPGHHQLRWLKPRSFGSLAVDAVRVYKGAPLDSPPLYWGATGAGGSGTWDMNTTANWWDGTSTTKWFDFGGMDYAAVFAGAAGTVSLAGNVNVNHLTFNTSGYTLQNNTLTFNGNNPGVTVGSAVTAALRSAISGPGSLAKDGLGTLALVGTNTYTGPTAVNAGTLLVNGALFTNTVTVAAGATLGGTGVIGGPVTVAAGAVLTPGAALGTLTLSNTLSLAPGSQTLVAVNAGTGGRGQIIGLSGVSYGGTLVVTNLAGSVTNRQTFQLFGAANRSGTFSAVSAATSQPGLTWSFDALHGVLTAALGVALTPPRLAWAASQTNLALWWPADHLGWTVLQQTNNLAKGLSRDPNDWMRVAGTSATNQLLIPVNQASPAGFYRLIYP